MRVWEILEKHDEHKPYKEYDREHEYDFRGSRMGRRTSEYEHDHEVKKMVKDAYECGFEEGYREAMLEAEKHYSRFGERRMK
jgi:hypothetical protein